MKIAFALLACLAFSQMNLQRACANEQSYVRVRLLANQKKIELTGAGISIQGEEEAIQQISIPKNNQTLKISRVQIRKKQFWKVESSAFPNARLYSNKALFLKGQQLMLGSLHLPSKLILNSNRNIDLIGFVPMKEYLYGVVSKEMPARWPQEALKAQAIAARTYTLYMKKEKAKNAFDVESSVLDQVFSKIENSNLSSQQETAVKIAVDETEGIFLSNQKGLPVKTYYHADCGGRTSSSEAVFGAKGLAGGAIDESCPANPKAKWTLAISKEQLTKKMAGFFEQPAELLQISKLEKLTERQDLRAKEIKVISQNGESQILNANDFREKLGFQYLRSLNFQVEEKNDSYVFRGTGYGHGVGLCQWGSRKMAEKGIDYQRILSHYYPELDLNAAKNLQSEEGHSYKNKQHFN